eukprot:366569-Chlamydomonas_euryale.AAC.35
MADIHAGRHAGRQAGRQHRRRAGARGGVAATPACVAIAHIAWRDVHVGIRETCRQAALPAHRTCPRLRTKRGCP